MKTEAFRERLCYLRTKHFLTAREMSLALGQSASYIYRIENGLMMPSMEMFFNICKYLKITPAEFFSSDCFSDQT